MAELSTAVLHARADEAAAAGDFPRALRATAEALHAAPLDHRARLKGALCFAMLGRNDVAIPALVTVAEQLARQGFYLSALGACRDALGLQADAPAVMDLLRRVHTAVAGHRARARARVPPPVMPAEVSEAREGSFLQMDDATLAAEAGTLLTTLPAGLPDDLPSAAVPFFSDLPEAAFLSLMGRLEYKKVPPGTRVVTEGEEGTALYVLIEGEVKVSQTVDGVVQDLARLGTGSLFGELALLTARPRNATVETVQPAELFCVARGLVGGLAAEHPELAEAIADFARRRVLMNMMARSALFKPLDEEARHALLAQFHSSVVTRGQVLIQEGVDPAGLYVVVEGEVEITKTDEGGDTVVLAYLRPGDVFGEIGLLEDRPTTATATATDRGAVLFLAKGDFGKFTEAHPELKAYLSTLSTERLEETEEVMSDGVVLEADDLIIL